ncbi:hypothetical protein R84B8_00429 [Treponema sp. R8-4-B8]
MGFDSDGKPDYETWLRMKEGNSPYRELEDAINISVENKYKGTTCPRCGMMGTLVTNHIMECKYCGNNWSIYS